MAWGDEWECKRKMRGPRRDLNREECEVEGGAVRGNVSIAA